ncbi:MAG: DDE-type integrase/transposase/recombinase, partial [Flavobacteriales bacterium]|nr:DDE-type integrase/transposase/recombinase [Flavobacteriales bacterium]
LVTDAYSRRIVGHHLSKSLDRAGCVQALKMALSTTEKTSGLIHHSDRGVQYCSKEYTTLLEQNQIRISMTQNSQPLDNPIAERINGIIKAEFLDKYNLKGLTEARMQVRKAVALYNQIRPHNSLKLATPNQVHYIYDNLQQELKTVVNL